MDGLPFRYRHDVISNQLPLETLRPEKRARRQGTVACAFEDRFRDPQ
jgi:hypothetical protein